MKKLLAILLILMLPICAIADTRELTIRVETNEIPFQQVLRDAFKSVPTLTDGGTAVYVQLIHHVLNGLEVNIKSQKDAFQLTTALKGVPFVDLKQYSTAAESRLTSTLLPGYAILLKNHSHYDDQERVKADDAVLSVLEAIDTWLGYFEPTMVNGSFHGDAYEGGVWCTTVSFTDSDIAALLSSISTQEVRSAFIQMLSPLGKDASEILDAYDAENARVADEDAHMYLLRIVSNEEKKPIGASLTIIRELEQIATVSLGFINETITLVIGLGLDQQNYWCELTAVKNQNENITYWSGRNREWLVSKAESFAYAKANRQAVFCSTWHCSISTSGERQLWDGAAYQGENRDAEQRMFSFSGKSLPASEEIEGEIVFGSPSNVLLSMTIHAGNAETIAHEQMELHTCSPSAPEDEALYHDLLNQFAAAVTARLVKILPLELLIDLNQIMSP